MKNKLTHNLGLKLVALLFSAVLWMVATDINDPLYETPYYNVSVQLVNTGSITAQNKTYKVLENTDTVKVIVKGPSSVLSSISKDNIVAKADLSKMTEENTVPIEVSLNDKSLENDIESIKADNSYVLLEIEEKRTEQLSVEVVRTGTLPEGYAIGKVSTDTNTISISGPASVIDPVKRAVVEVSMDGVVSDVNMQTQIRLLDEDGKEINNSNIKKNIESVRVTVPVLKTKTVPVTYQTTGTPADGYVMTGNISCVPQNVVIAGKDSALEEISEIAIPASELDVTDATESVTKTVNIQKYLPTNISLAGSDFNGNVTLSAEIEAIRRKTINLTESTIPVLNVPEGWLAELVPGQNLRVTVRGLQRNLADVTETALQPHINVSTIMDGDGNLTAGEQDIVINFIVPDDVQQEGTVKAVIRLTKLAEE